MTSDKVIIFEDKKISMNNEKFQKQNDNYNYDNLFSIDKLSYYLFIKSRYTVFNAIPTDCNIFTLEVANQNDYQTPRFNNGYGSMTFLNKQKIVIKKCSKYKNTIPYHFLKEVVVYKLFEKTKFSKFLPVVYDICYENSSLYLEYGKYTLNSYIKNLEQDSIPVFLYKIILMLKNAYSQGIIHCDIKPDNIIIRDDGKEQEPLIIDWGCAQIDRTK
jgi:serine/threonine protein kinase